MQLVADIGNTAMKFAFFDGTQVIHSGIGMEPLEQMLRSGTLPDRCLIASVADHGSLSDLLKKYNIPFDLLSLTTALPIANLYETPETLGADRLTLAVAAHRMFGGATALVIAAGTCITYNLVEKGAFCGGAISPGITMRFSALEYYTARLPNIDWGTYRHDIFDTLTGTDTKKSILSGVLGGVIREVAGTIEAYQHRYSGLQVAVTGGDMDFLVKNLKNGIFARPDMVLEGLNYILLHNA